MRWNAGSAAARASSSRTATRRRRRWRASPGPSTPPRARLADAAEALLGEERYDLVWLTFNGAHQAGHYLWARANGSGPGTAVEDVYTSADEALGRILAALPEDADVIAFAPLGMDDNASMTDLLPAMLAAVLSGRRNDPGAVPGSWIWRLRELAPAELRALVTRPLRRPPSVR